MELAKRFEELEIWKGAGRLHRLVWEETRASKDFEFRHQIRRAALSVMNNVAEGFERRTSKDFDHFLDLAKSSCRELRSMALVGKEVGVFEEKRAADLRIQTESPSKRIAAFARHLRRKHIRTFALPSPGTKIRYVG